MFNTSILFVNKYLKKKNVWFVFYLFYNFETLDKIYLKKTELSLLISIEFQHKYYPLKI